MIVKFPTLYFRFNAMKFPLLIMIILVKNKKEYSLLTFCFYLFNVVNHASIAQTIFAYGVAFN